MLRAVVTEAETRVGLAEAAAADAATAAAALEEMAQALESEQPLLARLRESVPEATLAACWRALRESGGLLHPARHALAARRLQLAVETV